MEERPNYYSVVPASVRYDSKLRANEKILYSEITALCQKKGYCYATNEYFAGLYDVEKETVSRWISNLKKCGYIGTKLIYKEDNKTIDKRIIWIADIILREIAVNYCENGKKGIDEIINTYLQKSQEGIDEKVKENNTSINNITTTIVTKEKSIYEIVEENFGRPLGPMEYEEINSWTDNGINKDLIKYAIKKAVLKGVSNIAYISKTLYEYQKNNIKTVQQAEASTREYNNRRQQNKMKSNRSFKRETAQEKYERAMKEAKEYDERENVKNE